MTLSECLGGIMMLGEEIKRLRERRGLSQEQIAKRLGLKKQSISNWENGNAMPSMDMFLNLVELFNTTPNVLLGYETEAGIDVSGLTEKEIQHIVMLIDDLKAHHKTEE